MLIEAFVAVEEATWRKCTLHNSRKEWSDLARHGGDACISLENMEPLRRDAVQRMQQQLMSVPWSTTTVCGDPPSQRQERMEQTYGSDRPLAQLRSPCSRSLLASIFPKDSSKWADAQRAQHQFLLTLRRAIPFRIEALTSNRLYLTQEFAAGH